MSRKLTTTWRIDGWTAHGSEVAVTVRCDELKEKMTFCRKFSPVMGTWRWTTNLPSPLDRVASSPMANMLDALVLDHPHLSVIAHLYGIFIPESQVECNR